MPTPLARLTAALVPVRRPLLEAGGIAALDLVHMSREWPTPVVALLDEPAHLTTARLLLTASRVRPAGEALAWTLVGSVLIDLDHVPMFLGKLQRSGREQRPLTHSGVTSLVLLAAAAATRGRVRPALAGLSLGVALHLVRDLGTGGIPLLWPLSGTDVRVPYAAYAAVLGGAVTAAALRRRRAGTAPAPEPGALP